MNISDSIFELACDWGFLPSFDLMQEWPTFERIALSNADSHNLANVLQAAMDRGEPEAANFRDVIPLLRAGGVVLEEILESDGSLSDTLRILSLV